MTVNISICIPTWNDAEWLPDAIDSVLAQTHSDWELVIGDNNSEQDIQALVSKYDDSRVRYHRWQNHTDLRENWNRTAQICEHEWVIPMSADDRLERDFLEKIARRAEAEASGSRLSMIMTNCVRVDPENNPVDHLYFGHSRIIEIPDGTFDAEQWFEIMSRPGHVPWNMGSIAFSRDVMRETGWFRPDAGYGYDMEVVLRASIYGRVSFINEKLFRFTVRDISDSAGRALRVLRQNDEMTPMEAAWNSALHAHRLMRPISRAEEARIKEVVARSHLQRALQHRIWPGAGGRSAAFADTWRAFTIAPKLMLSPWMTGTAALAIVAPRWGVNLAMKRLTLRRRGRVSAGAPWRA